MKKALITGVAGQDGSYLAESLLAKGYEVVGILRRHSSPEHQTSRLAGYMDMKNLTLVYGDITDLPSLLSIIKEWRPDEIYHLAAQSHVKISFTQPSFTTDTIAVGTLNILEATKLLCPDVKIYLAGSSEMFGNQVDADGYRRETTKMVPVSPYGCSKTYAYHLGQVYRESYGMQISNGILFNHESPRRGINFVTNKIIKAAVDIKRGKLDKLHLGNLDATRDWGHAKDYVEGMHLMLQQDKPDDFVCATGESRSVRDLCKYTFNALDLLDYSNYVEVDPKFYRPFELNDLKGDPTKAEAELGWKRTYTFESMIDEMIEFWSAKL